MTDLTLSGVLAQAYAGALHAVALSDGDLEASESASFDDLVARRCGSEVDREALFFDKVTPESFAAAVRKHAGDQATAIGKALIGDAVELAIVDSDLRGNEAHAILRFARSLQLTQSDVASVTGLLNEWISDLG